MLVAIAAAVAVVAINFLFCKMCITYFMLYGEVNTYTHALVLYWIYEYIYILTQTPTYIRIKFIMI